MELLSLNIGVPRTFGDVDAFNPMLKEWTSGILKEPVVGPVFLGRVNLVGDRQADHENHGGPDKAVNAYPGEHYSHWQATLGIESMPHGAFGENFTTSGLLEGNVCIGDVFQVGEALVQISQPRQPCRKLARRWQVKDLAAQVQETGRTGWYFRVLREGVVEAGMSFSRVEQAEAKWSVTEANAVMFHRKDDLAAASSLASHPALSESWRQSLLQRV